MITRLSVATAGPRWGAEPGPPPARPPPKLREFPPPVQRGTRREDLEGNRIGVNAAPDAEARLRAIRLRQLGRAPKAGSWWAAMRARASARSRRPVRMPSS